MPHDAHRAASAAPPRPGVMVSSTLLAVALGCGGAPRPATHADFRRVQVEEATVLRGLRAARDDLAPCASRLEGATHACDAGARVCSIAGDVDDADVQARCAAAERVCKEATRAANACDVPDPSLGGPT